jgi:leucyl-tRNA synthetase
MMEYGTGAVMSVPAHDERDFDFATKFGLPIKQVIEPSRGRDAEKENQRQIGADGHGSGASGESAIRSPQSAIGAVTDYGVMINSGEWNGTTTEEAKTKMAQYAKENGFGEAAITYRLRDWGVSRQRFWGSPIPIIYCDSCGTVPEKYENLPVRLPENAPFTGTGESPLTKVPEFYETTCPECGGPLTARPTRWTRSSTRPGTFSATPIRRMSRCRSIRRSPRGGHRSIQYIGGDDHAVMHLIYTRFWAKVMRDIGLVSFDEPVKRLLTQGMVVGETFFDDETGKRIYYPADTVAVTRDAKGKHLDVPLERTVRC